MKTRRAVAGCREGGRAGGERASTAGRQGKRAMLSRRMCSQGQRRGTGMPDRHVATEHRCISGDTSPSGPTVACPMQMTHRQLEVSVHKGVWVTGVCQPREDTEAKAKREAQVTVHPSVWTGTETAGTDFPQLWRLEGGAGRFGVCVLMGEGARGPPLGRAPTPPEVTSSPPRPPSDHPRCVVRTPMHSLGDTNILSTATTLETMDNVEREEIQSSESEDSVLGGANGGDKG